jgi:hypothetical protein
MDITYYLTYDLPVQYKNIKLYPVTVKDYLLFNIYSQCLTIDKNSIPDPNIISMTYLEYIFKVTTENPIDYPYLIWFDRLLSMCLKDDNSFEKPELSIKRYKYDEEGKPFFTIGEESYTSDDFEEIRKIIAEQNSIELIDENISKEVRDSLEAAREFKRKQSGGKIASTEDYMIALSIATGFTLDYIHTMTIRKFIKSIRRADNLIHYKIYLASSMSGMVEFKDKSFIIHWLSGLDDEDKYSDVSVDLQEVQDKVSFESAKK